MADNISEKKWQDILDYLTARCDRKTFKKALKEHNCSKMVMHCLSDPCAISCLTSWMEQYIERFVVQKSTAKGNEYRTKGNDRFKVCDYVGSLHFYSKSVCHTPLTDQEFSLALANRSAALFYLQHYQECLQDIDLALQSGYPKHLKYKLMLRRGKVHLVKKDFQQAVRALKDAENCVPDGTKDVVHSELQKALSVALSNVNLEIEVQDSCRNDLLPIPKSGENEVLKYASAAITLKENLEKGRHIVANSDIKKGDVLFVEKPFAFVVLPGPSEIVCHHCCTPVHAQIPCKDCVSAIYCSQSCCYAAWESYHKWECNGLEVFYSVGIAHLGLRLLLISATTTHDVRYDQVMSLVSHVEDMELDDAYQYCLTASLLTLYLQKHSNFFVNSNLSISEIGGKIMFHICQLICNGHAITKVVPSSPSGSLVPVGGIIEMCQEEWAATAIFPSASMMNHSCDPNIINSFCREYLIVQAVRDITCGDEVLNCYGPYYRRMNTKERKEVLKKQYFFNCPCFPCQQDGNKDFLAQFSALRCNKCSGPLLPSDLIQGSCLDCGYLQVTTKLMEETALANRLYDEGLTKMEDDEIIEAVEIFETTLSQLSRYLYRYHMQIRECRDNIAKCYATLKNFNRSASYLIDNLESVGKQFGENSIEVANEIQKLTDLLIADLRLCKLDKKTYRERLKTAKYYINKSLEVYKVHYGPWNDSYQQMSTKDLFVKELESKHD